MADWIPVVSQLKSLVQVMTGDAEGAERTQINFSRQCPVISQARSAVELISGDIDAAGKTQLECLKTVSGAMDSTPVVGHVKGALHYACGDVDGGDNAMKASSRATGVLAGGAGGFVLGGPAGALAGGIVGGAGMDSITTGIDSAVHGEFRPAGYYKHADNLIKKPDDGGEWFDTAVTVVGDGLMGDQGGKMVQNVQNYNARKQYEKQRKPLDKAVGKAAAKDMVKAGDRMRKLRIEHGVDADPHFTSVVKDLETKKYYEGHNRAARRASSASNYSNPDITHFEKRFPDKRPNTAPHRPPRNCAEHRAYDKFYKENPTGKPEKTRVSTVKYEKGQKGQPPKIKTADRCNNCKNIYPMGECPGDHIPRERALSVPAHPRIKKNAHIKDGCNRGKAIAGLGRVFEEDDEYDDY